HVMEEAVLAGPAVLVGRGAQCMLASRADALHVFCYAPPEVLASYAVTNLGVAPADAARVVAENNHQREQYVKRHWKREWRDLANYHLCVNTGALYVGGAPAAPVDVGQQGAGGAHRRLALEDARLAHLRVAPPGRRTALRDDGDAQL